MDARTFLGLRPTHNPYRWNLDVAPGLVTLGGFLFGGCGLGAAIAAMEGTSGRPCIWATAQYLAYATTGQVLDVDVTMAVDGKHVTQARAVGHVGNREILTVNAALGDRPFDRLGQFEVMPEASSPEDSPPRLPRRPGAGTISERIDLRVARGRMFDELDGTPGDGRTLLWARIPEVIDTVDAAALAVLGDHVPSGVGQALGIQGGGNSLDNTLRVGRLVPTEWVLLDIQVHNVERGFAHGLVHMWATDGTLLATASQSCIVRYWEGDPAR